MDPAALAGEAMMWALALLACGPLRDRDTGTPPPAAPLAVADLWAEDPVEGRLTLPEVVVTSPRTADGERFYVQQPGGGPWSGLQVEVADGIVAWPPPVGTPIRLTGDVVQVGGRPTLWLWDRDDLVVLGDPVPPVAAPLTDDDALVWALVQADGVTVTSSVDPAGIAATDTGFRLRPDFGVPSPGYGQAGDLVAIRALGLALLLRTPADWTGGMAPAPAVRARVAELRDLPPGTPVVLDGAVQATGWSRTGRYAVLQDPLTGDGVWVDTEGAATLDTAAGDVGTWTGQVAEDRDGFQLRVWDPPVLSGTAPVLWWDGAPDDAPDGALVADTIAALGAISPRGERACDDWLLDDRFRHLDDLTDPDEVVGAVRVDAAEVRRLAVLDLP